MSERGQRPHGLVPGILVAVLWGAMPTGVAFGATQQENLGAYRDQVTAAQRLVAACAADASGCNADAVPPDSRVAGAAGVPGFNANWGWLRDAVGAAKKSSAQKRAQAMQEAEGHLAEFAQQTAGEGAPGSDAASFGRVRQTANSILSRAEFRAADGPSWLDRQLAKLQDWLARAFMGMASVGARNPWIAPLIEWTFFGLAAGGLLFFVRRSLARQSLRIALGEAAAAARRSDRDATDWARLAEERAAARDWREAVHCLYWAAIVSLEARNAWRPNPTRTPREYVRLLRPGSEAQQLLRQLTGQFERVWYGHRELEEADFRAAQGSFAGIRAADLRGSGGGAAEMVSRTAAAGAS